MKSFGFLKTRIATWYLGIILSIFFLLRFPSLFEPYWYGDEGIYEVIGAALRNGRMLYAQIWDNKPPLLYIFYAVFGESQFSIRLVSLIFGLGAVVAFYALTTKLFQLKTSRFVSTTIFAFLFATPLIEGNIANAENFMLLPIITAAYFVISSLDQQTKTKNISSNIPPIPNTLFLAGLLLGLAFLFKIVALFDFTAFFLFILFCYIQNELPSIKEVIKEKMYKIYVLSLVLFVAGFFLPIVFTAVFFLLTGTFSDFIQATFFSNIGYVGYNNKFLFPQGLLVLKLSLLFIWSLIIFLKRKKLTKSVMFLLLWLAFSLFDLFFSQRPYSHYLLVFLPSFSLLIGFLFLKQRLQLLFTICFILLIFIIDKNFSYYGYNKTLAYYRNFIDYASQKRSMILYQAFFDKITPRDYQIASFITSHTLPSDTIFLWGNSGQIYALSNKLPPGKFIVAYHVTTNEKTKKETADVLTRTKPKYIFIFPQQDSLPTSLENYKQTNNIQDVLVYERIY